MHRGNGFSTLGRNPGRPTTALFSIRHSLRGATLIEVVVALGLIVVALTIVGQLIFTAINESVMARRRAQGALLAQEMMEETIAHRNDLPAWEKKVDHEFARDKESSYYRFKQKELSPFRWWFDYRRVEGHDGVRKVIVKVYWRRPYGKTFTSNCELQTLLAIPSGRKAASTNDREDAGT